MNAHTPAKRSLLVSMLALVLLILPACTVTEEQTQAAVVLPTPQLPYVAPIGDATLEYQAEATLYLPRFDSARLVSFTETITFSAARLDAESIIRALISHAGNGIASPLGGEVKLSLYGANPVEVSGSIATVNLAASALQLDRKTLYLCGQAIANTLSELSHIQYVNLLVMDKQLGLDVAATLPSGAFTRSMISDIGAVYDQLASHRVQAGEDPSQKQVATTATLYYPLTTVNGVIAEARNITFSSLALESMILQLLEELADGPAIISGSSPLPLLADILSETPRVIQRQDGGGLIVSLLFENTLLDMLDAVGVPRASLYGSLCYTLTTCIPNITGLMIQVGGERVEHVMLTATEGILFPEGLMLRSHFAPLLMDMATLYFADQDSQQLVRIQRPVPFYQRTNPRALLLALFRGPTAADSGQNHLPITAGTALSDADIIGISLIDQTLVINLSTNFMQAGKGLTQQQDRLLAYAMVNTLLEDKRANRICFFVGGKVPDGFTGEIDWKGLFYVNFGLAGQS